MNITSPLHQNASKRFGLVRTNLRGKHFEFLTSSSVFSKTKIDSGTRLLIESMVLPKKGNVLDIGCGYGAVGIAAAKFNPNLHVVMTDVNLRAVRLAKQNVELNKIVNAEVRLRLSLRARRRLNVQLCPVEPACKRRHGNSESHSETSACSYGAQSQLPNGHPLKNRCQNLTHAFQRNLRQLQDCGARERLPSTHG